MDERSKLLKCLAAADFAGYDMRLYLDTHPCDAAAQAAAKEYAKKAACLRKRFEEQFGPLTIASAAEMYAADDCGCCQKQASDSWLSDPWPWDCVIERRR